MPSARRTSSASRTTSGISPSASSSTSSTTSSPSTRPAARPNPCMRCNERIKFAALLEKALALGFDAVATGHYASIVTDADGNRELHRAAAWAKDQSYVLGVLTADQLAHSMFPLGATPSKAEVRAEAAARGFSVAVEAGQSRHLLHPRWRHPRLARRARRRASAATSSIATGACSASTRAHSPSRSASARDSTSVTRRMTASRASCSRFVPVDNTVVVGPREALDLAELAGSKISWAGMPPADPSTPFDCEVQIRAHADPVPAVAFVRRVRAASGPARAGHPSGQSAQRRLARPVRGDLRRHPRARPVHDRPHGLAPSPPVSACAS